ncbi:MAG: Uma2 family endonuclease [Candidatus Poribacteria bacterium]|nr:Uma2 family endonuclease [Candidatus Poribacteria bacterium]
MANKEVIEQTGSDISTSRIRYAPTNGAIIYPESDGKPMAETELHRNALINALIILIEAFKDKPDVCVSGNMMMYYVEGDPKKSVSPDVFVSFGIGKKLRRTYRVWEEGKPPDFVLEFSSEKTHRTDQNEKKLLYASIGVQEYFLYDPERQYLPTPLMGFRLIEGKFVPIPADSDGSVMSATLNLKLRLRGNTLGFYDTVSSKWLETPADTAAAQAEQEAVRADEEAARADRETARADQEAEIRKQAEAEAARLREELERLTAQNTS